MTVQSGIGLKEQRQVLPLHQRVRVLPQLRQLAVLLPQLLQQAVHHRVQVAQRLQLYYDSSK